MNEREKVVQLENLRLSLLRQIEKQQIEAFKPLLKNYSGPVKVESSITEEMVKDYQDEHKDKPIEIDGKLYKYHPLLDELELEEDVPFGSSDFLPDATVKTIKNELQGLETESEKISAEYETELKRFDKAINKTENNIKNIKIAISRLPSSKPKSIRNREKELGRLIDDKDTLQEMKEDFIKTNHPNLEDTLKDMLDRSKVLKRGLFENDNKKRDNDNANERNRQINEERRKERINTVQLLNIGKFNMQRGPLETNEQYLKRLEDTTSIEVSEEVVTKEAEIDNIKRLKNNLKDIVRNESRIENIVKSFNTDDIFIINTNWVVIRKSFLETYGSNNKNLNAPEIVAILITILDDIKNNRISDVLSKVKDANIDPEDVKDFVNESKEKEDGLDSFNDLSIAFDEDVEALRIENDGKECYFKIIYKKIGSKKQKYLAVSFEKDPGNNGKYTLIRPTKGGGKLREYAEYLGIDLERLRKNLGIPKQYFLTYDALPYIEHKFNTLETPSPPAAKLINPAEKIWGYGMANKLPEMCKFGKVYINIDKLYHKNILSVTTHNKLKIMGFQNTRVSEAFVALIMKLCKKENLLPKDINSLNLNEKELYDHLVHVAQLNKDLQSNSDQTIEKIKHRFALIQGQIDAGNNNPDILKDLYGLLTKMIHFNLITQSEFKRYYKQVAEKFNNLK
jgi:hypothetical protein